MSSKLTWAQQWVLRRLRFDHAYEDQALSLPQTMEEWNQVLDAACKYGLTGFLVGRLSAGGVPDAVCRQLERSRIGIQHRNLDLWLAVDEWLERFQAIGIPVVVLKGAALTRLVYGSLDRRPMTDIDFLVERENFPRAGGLLTEAGLVRAVDVEGNPVLRTQSMFCAPRRYPIYIDLHWHLIDSGYYVRRVPIRWFWEHTVVLGEEKPAIRVLSPEAQLLHLVAHLELHHAGAKLLSLYDIAALLDRFGTSMNWDFALDAASRFELGQSLRIAVQRAQEVFGIPIPEHVNARLSNLRATYHERLARTLATPEAHPAAFIFDGWDQERWRPRFSYWKRSLFPAKAFMHVRNQDLGASSILHYLQRLARGLIRIPRALTAGVMIFWRVGRTGVDDPLCSSSHDRVPLV